MATDRFDFFISYARSDDPVFAAQLYSVLTAQGHSVWFDKERMPSRGQTFLHEIREAIAASTRVIVILGPSASRSDYVRCEWQYALSLSKPVTPLLRQGSYDDIPSELRLFHAPDVRTENLPASSWAEIHRILSERLRELADLRAVPQIPPKFQPETTAVTELCALLLRDQASLAAMNVDDRVITITGLPGSGKTVLASALARMTPVRHTYAHIIWISCGPRFGRTSAEEQLTEIRAQLAVGIDRREVLRTFESSAILVVLDDIWNLEGVQPFLNDLGNRSRVLLTTREAWIADSLSSQRFATSPFTPATALSFLASWVNVDVSLLPPAARSVAEYCENLPLALAMAGALAKSGIDWSDILAKLLAADLQFVGAQLINYPYRNLAATLKVSVDNIGNENVHAAEVLSDLAVFEADAPISKFAIETYASQRHRLDTVDVRRALVFLSSRSLLTIDEATVTLHSLIHAYISGGRTATPQAHRDFVSSFEALCNRNPNGEVDWCTAPRDEYIERHLVRHLILAERVHDAERVVADGRWPFRKINHLGVTAVLRDYHDYLSGTDSPSDAIKKFAQALARTSHILRRDPSQYRLQMHLRLGGDAELGKQFGISRTDLPQGSIRPNNPRSDVPPDGLIAQCSERRGVVLCGEFTTIRGRRACVTGDSVGVVTAVDISSGEVLYRLDAHKDHVRALAVTREKALLATGSGEWLDVHRDCSIKLWSLDTGDHLATLSACDDSTPRDEHSHQQPIGDLEFAPDGSSLISASWDATIGIWDVVTRKHIRTLKGHSQGLNTATATAGQEFIVSGSADGTIGVWDYTSGELLRMQDPEAGAPIRIRPVRRSTRVAFISEKEKLLVLDVASGRLLHESTFESTHITGILVMSDKIVRLSTSDGSILDVDVTNNSTTIVKVVDQPVDAAQFSEDRYLALNTGNLTAFYDLTTVLPHSEPDDLEFGAFTAAPSGLPDVACVVGRAGTISVHSISPVRQLASRKADDWILHAEHTPDGVLTRSKDRCIWWTFSRANESTGTVLIDIARREIAPGRGSESCERFSRNLMLVWQQEAWALGTVYRFADATVLWRGYIGRPRELQVFLSHELEAPSIAGTYYGLSAVDYERDRFALYQNGQEGILLFQGNGQSSGSLEDGVSVSTKLVILPYGRYVDFISFVPGTSQYLESTGSRLVLWDLDTERLVAETPSHLVEDAVMDLSTAKLTTIGRDGVLRQYEALTLRMTFEIAINSIGSHLRLLSVTRTGLIALTDQINNLYIIDSTEGRVFCPVGFDSRPVGCIFSKDGSSALVVERCGLISGFDLPS